MHNLKVLSFPLDSSKLGVCLPAALFITWLIQTAVPVPCALVPVPPLWNRRDFAAMVLLCSEAESAVPGRAQCLGAGDVRGAGSGTSRPFVPTTAGLQKPSAAGGGGLGCKWSGTCPLLYPQCPYQNSQPLGGQWFFFRGT